MAAKVDKKNKKVILQTKDYLRPTGKYSYDLLPVHCEKWLAKGYRVYVDIGFGWPNGIDVWGIPGAVHPWHAVRGFPNVREYDTAREALGIKSH